MKKILYSLLVFASATLFAQKNQNVKFAICNDAVGTVNLFNARKAMVQSTTPYKAATLPTTLKKYSYLAQNGLTEVKYKQNVGTLDWLPLSIFNTQYQLPENNPVIIEGYEFSDSSTKIYSEIIDKAEVKEYNGKKTLFITTIQKYQ
ncbi:hypothetical protein JI747_001180 [Chryseobacterium sp. RG1]|jgi:hypothetical protein|uniref:Uncharacterized protein n=1 Tax=Chryseobacterium tagetis TaxID=2801334 RepID=A0ABS7ZVL4_9FLAO|nr:hypothetical protein [Chryseobacterium tagetis]MCA6065769.1 hypothetical protein [Chryseobacterium tagetis]